MIRVPLQKSVIAPFYPCKRNQYDPISHWDLGSRHITPTSLIIRVPLATFDCIETTHVLGHRFKLQNYVLVRTGTRTLPTFVVNFSCISAKWHNCTSTTQATKKFMWNNIEKLLNVILKEWHSMWIFNTLGVLVGLTYTEIRMQLSCWSFIKSTPFTNMSIQQFNYWKFSHAFWQFNYSYHPVPK